MQVHYIMTEKQLFLGNIFSHVVERGVDPNVHKFWVDEIEGVATFPITNLSGQLVGYQQYRPSADKKRKNNPKEGRYYTYTLKDTRGVWGLESWTFSNTLFLTEGIFGSARLTRLGVSSVALLSNDPKHLSDFLFIIRQQRPLVAICDYGYGGSRLAKFGHKSLHMTEDFDIDEATDEYILMEVINKFNVYTNTKG